MGGQGRQIGGLALCVMGVLGVCLACGLPMWRDTSFVGANIVTAQSVWDGLWLHCILQATGQMQCKRHTSSNTMTPDIQAGRALTLLSILAGFLGFMVTLLGGGVANCSGAPPDPVEPPSTSSSRKKACLLGGALCVLSGILCLVSVSWSAGATISIYNDPFVAAALKREVGSSIYIGWASAVLLLLSGALICFVCCEKERPPPSYHSYMPYGSSTRLNNSSSRRDTLKSDVMRSNSWRMFDQSPNRMLEHAAQVHDYHPLNKAQSWAGLYNHPQGTQPGSEQGTLGRNLSNRSGTPDDGEGLFMGMKPNLVRDVPSRATTVPSEYYYDRV
ncbi:claudin-4-like [Seriola lalandi dorsalis]|uniref:Claudin-4-like n=1 Tax=Seriola lalandi dorsalis TaxID=1841481 RepID=A0A3B4Y7R1_SERLL|nr:claudin-4-like [Seriola lalandi dorsalis]